MPRVALVGRSVVALASIMIVSHASAAERPDAPGQALDVQAVNQPAGKVRFDGDKVVRVQMRNLRDVQLMLSLSNDPWTCGWDGVSPGRVDFRVSAEAFKTLTASDVPFHVMIGDVQTAIDNERPKFLARDASWYADYKAYADVNTYLNTMVTARPDLASRVTVGNSLLGNDLPCIRISSAPVGAKPAIFVIGCQHAREWITVMSTTYVADQLVSQYGIDPTITQIVDNYEVYVLPIANPDGYLYTWATNRLWRKNRRNNDGVANDYGVDLNRNWGAGFGGPGSSGTLSNDTYRGPSAFSEPETTALKNFVDAHPNMALFFDIHSYSELVLSPWGNTLGLPPDSRAFDQLTSLVQSAIYANSGVTYYAGSTYRTIYPASGTSDDWTYQAHGFLSIALELRGNGSDSSGFTLPADQIIPTAQEWFAGFKAAAQWELANQVVLSFPNQQPTKVQAGTTTNVLLQFNRGLKTLVGTPTVSTRVGRINAFTTVPVTSAGTDETGPMYSHGLTAGTCGSVVQWYYTAQVTDGVNTTTVNFPPGGAAAPFQAIANGWSTVFSDDFEAAHGWLVGDPSSVDTATTGKWTRVDPNGYQAQVEYDHTPLTGTQCYVTGQNASGSSYTTTTGSTPGWVSGGKTTLRSPVFDLSAATNPEISVWISFFNDHQYPPFDPLKIDITNNATAGTPTWVSAVLIAGGASVEETTGHWKKYTIPVSSLVSLTNAVQVRIVATSAAADVSGQGNWIEAAVDDFSLISYTCQKTLCPGDFNEDGNKSVQDLFDFLTAWFSHAAVADFNNSGTITVQDLFDFLGAWFAGCP